MPQYRNMAMAEWDLEWKIATAKLDEAKWDYSIAESQLARATAVMNEAQREVDRLFHKRVHAVNG
jgi:hypothetical protein